MVLAHECAHLRRRDPFWLAVSQCFLALQWFNPLAWAAVKNYRLASERAADDAVLVATQDAPAYAGLLVACARVRAALPPVLCAMASPSTVGQRVEHILNEAADRRRAGVLWPAAWVAAFHLVAAGVLWISPVLAIAQEPVAEAPAEPPLPPDAGPAPATDPGADLRNAFESKVVRQVQWSDTLLSHALKELHEKTGVNFILRGDEDKKLTLHLREAPLREVISAMCEATGMQFDPQETAVVISPAAAPLMETRTFLLPDKLAAEISDNGSANKLLEQAGILAAEGSLVSFEPASHRLIAKNTRHELERIENWVETGRADAAFAWTPVKLEQREYVSAHKVRRFYGFTSFQPGEGEAQDTILFKSPVLHMQWRKDSPDILIHGAKFVLQLPIREHEGTL